MIKKTQPEIKKQRHKFYWALRLTLYPILKVLILVIDFIIVIRSSRARLEKILVGAEDEYALTTFIRGLVICIILETFFLSAGIVSDWEGYTRDAVVALLFGALVFPYAVVIVLYQTEVILYEKCIKRRLVTVYVVALSSICYFAFQYWFLMIAKPDSFIGFADKPNPIDYVFQSVMVFVFSPMIKPMNFFGQILMMEQVVTTFTMLVFVLQNMWNVKNMSSRK